MTTPSTTYRLVDLAHLTGIPVRTIRSYIQRKLLPPPLTRGRNARYARVHLDRLRAIQRLRDERGLGLTAIRRVLSTLDEPAIRALAAGRLPLRLDLAATGRLSDAPTALTYLRRLQGEVPAEALSSDLPPPAAGDVEEAQPGALPSASPAAAAGPARPTVPDHAPAELLLHRLGQARTHAPVPHQARAEEWFQIEVTPDLRLQVRGVTDEAHLRQLERLADYLRHLLIGGFADEPNQAQD